MSNSAALKLTLAISGGGAKAAAAAGVLAVLDQSAIPVGALAGVSAGGLVAVLYALGLRPAAIRDYMAETHLLEVWELDPARSAIFGAGKMRARLQTAVGDKTFSDLALPVVLVASDLAQGKEVHLTSGRLDDALIATMAVPGMFPPQKWEGRLVIDGGLLNPLPVDVARRFGRPVLAVDLLGEGSAKELPTQLFEIHGPMAHATHVARRLGLLTPMEVVHQAVVIMSRRLRDARLVECPPDMLLMPDVGPVGLFAFDLANYAYEQGEAAAKAALPQIAAVAYPGLTRQTGPAGDVCQAIGELPVASSTC
jgi:NTE family protein